MLRFVAASLFRVRVSGLANLPRNEAGRPAGGWICVGLPHRTWVEPVLLVALMPPTPRLAMMAEARTATGSWWRRLLVGLVGGVLPTGGGAGLAGSGARASRRLDRYAAGVGEVIEAGGVLSLFAETGPAIPPPGLRRVSPALAYFALRTGAPIVPVVFGGTHELFLGRRIEVRLLPALEPPLPAPAAGSQAERLAARRLHAELLARVGPAAAAAHRAAEPPSTASRRWRWLSGPYPRA